MKLKAFHKIRKEIYDVHSLVFPNEEKEIEGAVFRYTDDGIGSPQNPDDWDDVVLLQWTGLYDKNEKEIYQGHSIKQSGYNTREGEWTDYFEVVRDNECFHLKNNDKTYSFPYYENEGKICKRVEVTGWFISNELLEQNNGN